jgi:hypothetical protein
MQTVHDARQSQEKAAFGSSSLKDPADSKRPLEAEVELSDRLEQPM